MSDPRFLNESYIPKWLLNWSNDYYNLRTALPFVVFGFLLEFYSKQKIEGEMNNTIFNLIRNASIVTAFVCVSEIGQLFIQSRSPDLLDIFFGIVGSLLGALFYNLLKRLRNAK
ncbi:MAG: VanZ family protein [Flavobacterium micromati]|nr:VanZ family protein [Flavobacterium micromati]